MHILYVSFVSLLAYHTHTHIDILTSQFTNNICINFTFILKFAYAVKTSGFSYTICQDALLLLISLCYLDIVLHTSLSLCMYICVRAQ